MLQRQIVVKIVGKKIDIEDPEYTKYAGTSFQFIAWMLIFNIVTIKRNADELSQRYQGSHSIVQTTN